MLSFCFCHCKHSLTNASSKQLYNSTEQRCRDDTSCSSSMITQSVRQSPTTQVDVARFVGVPIGSYFVTNLINNNLGTTGDETIVRAEQERSQTDDMDQAEHLPSGKVRVDQD